MELTNVPRPFAPLVIVLLSVGILTQLGCCRRFDSQTKLNDNAANGWIHNWPGQYDWSETKDWREVSPPNLSHAEVLLGDNRFVLLSATQVHELLSDVKEPDGVDGTAFLFRAVGAAHGRFPLETFIRKNGDVWVGGGAISRCPVARERRAVIVWLEKHPNDAFATFGVAE